MLRVLALARKRKLATGNPSALFQQVHSHRHCPYTLNTVTFGLLCIGTQKCENMFLY